MNTQTNEYPICFCNDFNKLAEAAEKLGFKGRKLCIVTDNNVSKLYAENVREQLNTVFSEIFIYEFKAGETSKNLDTISDFYSYFLSNHFDRKTVIAGLGGGVTGDMAGFAAATYMRGIPFIQIPTTLLAQVDSSVGGKVGVDFKNSKNIVGAFYQPYIVYINIDTLKSLPKREFSAGMAEVIKYGAIMSKPFYEYLIENKQSIKDMNENVLETIIHKCCTLKADIVSKDEKEGGLREILNFGHTIGHGVETLMDFKLLHGECVGIGMIAAMYISFKKGNINKGQFNEFTELLKYFDIPVNVGECNLKANDIYKQLFMDKKVNNNKLGFVLVKELGEYCRTSDLTEQEVLEAITYIL